ncbi:MAG: extracellular solute-binding protein [Candidatus Limiplasma sp.]|nr:extracellular solute-binding protein [Candidatus Limiplasma sp.]
MNRRRIGLWLMTALLVFSLSACTHAPTATPQPAEPTAQVEETAPIPAALSLRITWTAYSGRGVAIQKIVDTYNAGSDAPIAMIGGDEDLQAVQALLDRNAPILYVLPYRFVKYFGENGALADLTEPFASERSAYYPQVWDLGTVGGATYGIPWLGHAMCLLYNRTLLAKAGVDAASITSRAAFVRALEQVEAKTNAKGIGLVGGEGNDISWMVNQFIYGFGGSLVSTDGARVTLNSEQSRAALGFYREVLGAHAQPTWQTDTGVEVMNHFRNQEVAFEIQGIWGVTDIQKNGKPFDVGVLPLKEIGACAEVGPMMLAVPAGMDEALQAQAVALIRYLISPKAQGQILLGEYSPEHDAYYPFRTPIRNDTPATEAFRAYPDYTAFIEGFENPSVDVPVPAWQSVKDLYYGSGLHRVMTGELTVDAFLAQIETEGNRILQNN